MWPGRAALALVALIGASLGVGASSGGDRIVVLSHRLANRLFGMVVPSLRTLKVDPAEVPKGE